MHPALPDLDICQPVFLLALSYFTPWAVLQLTRSRGHLVWLLAVSMALIKGLAEVDVSHLVEAEGLVKLHGHQ